MSTPSLLERLCVHRTVGSVPREEIAWVASHGTLRHLDRGGVLTSKNGEVEGIHVVLDGHLSIQVDRGTGPRKIMEWRSGDVTGLMPYSRMVSPPADVIAEEPTDVVTVNRQDMPEMIRECHELTAVLVHIMLDRARHFTSSYLHDEKLVSLGKLAAGLAHELNNLASAIARSASGLSASLSKVDAASRALGSAGLTTEEIEMVEGTLSACFVLGMRPVLSPLEQEDREDSIAEWLKKHQSESEASEALTESDVTLEQLDGLAASIKRPGLDAAIHWLAANCAARRLTSEIQEASSRIYNLVSAIKGFTQMDRSAVPEPVDIGQGLGNTLAVLRAKARDLSVGVTIDVENDLPPVNGFASELNQVWANLIDNALDAAKEGGRVELNAKREDGSVIVRVIDNGSGVPAEIRDRIFDPFFTTKPINKGTGLGLDIVRRLIQRHNGQIELESQPGRTEFRVILPVAEVR